MKILVLGGSGFIGSNLVYRLTSIGHDVKVYGHSPIKAQNSNSNVEYQYGNLSDLTAITYALQDVDVVFHLISSSIPSTSNLNPADDIRGNLVDTVGLLECMKKLSIRKIIYTSSGGTVYGDCEKELINEEHPLNPNCSYGIVKLAVEKYLNMYARLYGFEPVILRVSNPYGQRQGKVGFHGLIGTLLTKAIKEEPVEIWGDGEVVRDYLYIDDLIQACEYALNNNLTGVFNVGSGVGYSVNQVIKLVEGVTSRKLEVIYSQARAEDVKKIVLDIQKINKELHWEPSVTLYEGLKKYYQWLQSSN